MAKAGEKPLMQSGTSPLSEPQCGQIRLSTLDFEDDYRFARVKTAAELQLIISDWHMRKDKLRHPFRIQR